MTSPALSPRFADAQGARPLYALRPDALTGGALPLAPAQVAWLGASGFQAGLGEICLLPALDGTIAGACLGLAVAGDTLADWLGAATRAWAATIRG